MAIAFSILAVILGYSGSRCFPDGVPFFSKLNLDRVVKNTICVVFYGIALLCFIIEYGSGTGILVWLFTVALVLSLSILGLSYKPAFVYFFLANALVFTIFDILHYAG